MSILGVVRKVIHAVAILDSVLESFEQDRAHQKYLSERRAKLSLVSDRKSS